MGIFIEKKYLCGIFFVLRDRMDKNKFLEYFLNNLCVFMEKMWVKISIYFLKFIWGKITCM